MTVSDMRRPHYVLILAIALFLCAIHSRTLAGATDLTVEEKRYLKQKKTITFISQSHYPPFEFIGPDGDHTGMCIELTRWIATEYGFKVHFADTGFKRAQELVLSGKADVITSLFYSPKRDHQFDFSQMLFEVPAYIFVVAERPDIVGISDLEGKSIAMQAGDYALEHLKSNHIDFKAVYTRDFSEATDLVIAGKADAIIGDEQIVLFHIYSNQLTNKIKKVGAPLYTGRNCLAAKDPNPTLIGILDKGVALAKKKGLLDQINKKWTGIQYPPLGFELFDYLPYLLFGAGCFFTAAVLIWFWNIKLRQLVALRTAALAASERTLRAILAASPVGIGLLRDEKLAWHNQALRAMLGYTREELDHFDVRALTAPCVDPPVFSPCKTLAYVNTPTGAAEAQWLRKDGTVFDCLLRKTPLDDENQKSTVILIAEDVTERKKTEDERRQLEQRLHRAEKMEALGTMAGGVAHDLNNVLGVLVGYSELMLMKMPPDSPFRKYVSTILQSTQQGAAIIQDLLTLARRGVAISEVTNVNQIISDYLKSPEFETLKALNPGVTVNIALENDLSNIKGSPVHMSKTVMNLMANAAEAITGQGRITLCTQNKYIGHPLPGCEEMQAGDYVVITVTDTGKGISSKDLTKIFEPFYTRKVMGRSGTGLGLAVVWGTVRDHNGYINVTSQENKGSTFTLYFPATIEKLVTNRNETPVEKYIGGGETILVVDDVKEQRHLARNMLESIGYRVFTASGGEQAISYLKKNNADLLILDMIMDTGMNGLEIYQKALLLNPRQKAVIVSGFSETESVREAQRLGAGAYIRKPYLMEKIGMAIRTELDR